MASASGGSLPRYILQRVLLREDFVVVARPGNPMVGRRFDLACYLRCDHVLVSVGLISENSHSRSTNRRMLASGTAAGTTT